jgi:L-threonylcarbamoyladenylate synthase
MFEAGRIVTATPETISAAADFLRAGKLVAFPTETVYGLGGDATQGDAVARIFSTKGRPAFNPLICHVVDAAAAQEIAKFSNSAIRLADAFWPGPLTLVLPRAENCPVSRLASAGLDTIAVRVPSHETAQAILRAVDRPIAAPSANASGTISPTRARHVAASLGDKVDMILDGGACDIGIESTIVYSDGDKVRLLRAGAITIADFDQVLGRKTLIEDPSDDADRPASPGRLRLHYAPRTELRIDVDHVDTGEALLAFGPDLPDGFEAASTILNLSKTGDLVEAAANLFDCLHRLDSSGAKTIACVKIPETGLGLAINDRLRRAAAPREA